MNKYQVVFESPQKRDYVSLKNYVRKNIPVWIIEPFHAYHHKKGIRFFPSHLSPYILELLSAGKIKLIKHEELNAKEIYFLAADRAVSVTDAVFPEYRKEHAELIQYISDTLGSDKAEDVFKKDLCNQLAEFYSVNIMMHRVETLLGTEQILFYPDINVHDYMYLKNLLSKTKQDFFEHPHIRFLLQARAAEFIEDFKEYFGALTGLSAQAFASGLLSNFSFTRKKGKKDKKEYCYGVTIVSPMRQLADNRRGPDFIIDNNKIHAGEVVYFPLADVTDKQKKNLVEIASDIVYLPRAGRFFSHAAEWRRLLRISIKENFMRNGKEIKTACNVLFNYFRWLKVLGDIKIRHFITHCDFGANHIGRNLALNQAGVQTWYFTDSMNSGCNLITDKKTCAMCHPFWTYLHYDHFVTWDELLARYFKGHPGSFRYPNVV